MITSTPLQQQLPRFSGLACSLILFGSSGLWAASTPTAPAQKPMLTASTGAKPNLMVTLDNSGSMAEPFHESYRVTSDTKATQSISKTCDFSQGYYGADGTKDGAPDSSNRCKKISYSSTKTSSCISKDTYLESYVNAPLVEVLSTKYYTAKNCPSNKIGTQSNYSRVITSYRTITLTTAAAGQGVINNGLVWSAENSPWHAMRSADVNPIFYNPKFTYQTRVNADGSPVASDSLVFISNQNNSSLDYCVNKTTGKRYYNWRPGDFSSKSNCENSGSTYSYDPTGRVPSIIEYTSTTASTPAFTWVSCAKVVYDTSGRETNCKVADMVVEDIKPTRTTPITLPLDNRRTDCGTNATTCTAQQEITNILNWYRYYSYRADAVATSIGVALSNPDYREKLRIGYYNINEDGSANTLFPGVDTTSTNKLRGVRLSSISNNTTLYNWLYGFGSIPAGGTPLHNSLDRIAQYYSVASKSSTAAKENPWATDPSKRESTSNPELTCRRSFNLLFSDGAWSSGSSTFASDDAQGGEYDAPASQYPDRTSTTGLAGFNGYKAAGYDTVLGRKFYTPFGTKSVSGSLSDLTAKYYWKEDFRPALNNAIVARLGQPTTWQNMATYTIGYLVRPSGERLGATSGLTFDEIDDYKIAWQKQGTSASKPSWATSLSSEQSRVDDFIQAGFTGGGAAYSVVTPDDVRRAFDLILSDILNASGKDAGVAVAGTSSTTSTLEGRLKYTVGYKTIDNSGSLEAIRLDASGNNAGLEWSANDQMPTPQNRKLFVYDNVSGTRMAVGYNTRLTQLPTALQTAINADDSLPTDENFIRYLLGDDNAAAKVGAFRSRSTTLASSVNAPPLYVGARLNMGYGRDGSTVPGKSDYVNFFGTKASIPGTLYAATNDGEIHVFNAADKDYLGATETIKDSSGIKIPAGTELGAFLIKETMPKLKKFADPSYSFEYMTDGPLVEQDVWDGTNWKQMVFGTAGRGGKAVFAFNSPLNTTAGNKNRIPTENDYRWEVSLANMGYISNSVAAGVTTDGTSVLLVNSGHYASTGKAGLYVLNAITGAEIKFIELPSSYNHGLGLGGITVVRNTARQIVAAYAGDAGGNLWRFKLSGATNTWGVSNNQPLFSSPTQQPIYAAPAWQVHPGAAGNACQAEAAAPGSCGTIVVIGTGILLDDTHLSDTSTQSLYGIWDNIPVGGADVPYNRGTGYSLVTQTINLASAKAGLGSGVGNTYYTVSKNSVDWTQNYGWKLDLSKIANTAGERIIGDLFNLGSSVFATSVIISNTQTTEDSCIASSGAVNIMYGIDALTGGLKKSFDQDGDGKLDAYSIAYLPKGGFTRSSVLTQSNSTSNILDPNLKVGVGDPKEGDIDLLVRNKPTGDKGYNTGVDGTIGIGDGKDSAGWRRTWRQITTVPSSLM